MKNLFIIFTFNLLLSTAAIAQVQMGLKAGAMLSNAGGNHNSSVFNENAKLSYTGGAFLTFPINSKIGLQVEALYANQGNRFYSYKSGGSTSGTFQTNLHYISVPVLLQYYLLDHLTIEAGPEFSYLFSNHAGSSQVSFSSGQYKPFDLGLNVGVAYDLTQKVVLGLRYHIGLLDITKDYEAPGVGENPVLIHSNVHNRTLQLSVGFKLFR